MFKKSFKRVPLVDLSKTVEEVRSSASSQYPELTMSMLQPQALEKGPAYQPFDLPALNEDEEEKKVIIDVNLNARAPAPVQKHAVEENKVQEEKKVAPHVHEEFKVD